MLVAELERPPCQRPTSSLPSVGALCTALAVVGFQGLGMGLNADVLGLPTGIVAIAVGVVFAGLGLGQSLRLWWLGPAAGGEFKAAGSTPQQKLIQLIAVVCSLALNFLELPVIATAAGLSILFVSRQTIRVPIAVSAAVAILANIVFQPDPSTVAAVFLLGG